MRVRYVLTQVPVSSARLLASPHRCCCTPDPTLTPALRVYACALCTHPGARECCALACVLEQPYVSVARLIL